MIHIEPFSIHSPVHNLETAKCRMNKKRVLFPLLHKKWIFSPWSKRVINNFTNNKNEIEISDIGRSRNKNVLYHVNNHSVSTLLETICCLGCIQSRFYSVSFTFFRPTISPSRRFITLSYIFFINCSFTCIWMTFVSANFGFPGLWRQYNLFIIYWWLWQYKAPHVASQMYESSFVLFMYFWYEIFEFFSWRQ